MKQLLVSILFITIFPFINLAQQGFRIIKTFPIGGSGGWDYIAVGPGNNRLYIAHGIQVNILDLQTGDSIDIIPNTTGVHGIAFDKTQNLGFTSNGRLNNVSVFDLKTNQVTEQIATGENPDAIMYEPFSKTIITCNGRSKDLSVIDPVKRKIIATVYLGGKPETAVSDETGKLYVNIEDKSEIAVVNLKTFTVETRWSIAPGEAPTGLAIDKHNRRLFAGCDNKLLMVIDASSGKEITRLPIGDGCDGVAFDEATKNIFSSNGEGTLTVIQEKSANDFKVAKTVATKRGARTLAVDPASHIIYLPTADFEPADPAAPKARPKIKAGTFEVLVVKD